MSDRIQKLAFELEDDNKLIGDIVTAMQQTGHRWHDTPPHWRPNALEVGGVLATLLNALVRDVRKKPGPYHQVGTGGINVVYNKWLSGVEEIRVYYAPVSTSRSLPSE